MKIEIQSKKNPSVEGTDPEQIVRLLFARDEAALERLTAQYGPYCRKIAMNILGNGEDADECLNDTWLQIWNTVPPTRPRDLQAYLARTVRNLSLNRLRYRSAELRAGTCEAFDELENDLWTDGGIADGIGLRTLQEAVNHFLRCQPERERNVFIRRYYYAEDVEEIARRYGLTRANTDAILSRTRKKLKEALLAEGYFL